MKKLLILAYDFPPYVSVGGLRPYSWYEYFHEFGIYPIVVTRQWENKYGNNLDYIAASRTNDTIIEKSATGTIMRTPYKPNLANKILLKYGENKFRFLRKLVSGFYEIFQWFFNVGPKVNLYFAAKNYLKNNKVDFIIATGSPFILFRYASKLSKKFNITWYADYRDPWSQSKNRSKNKFFKIFNNCNEKRILKNAMAITTVSDFFKKKISEDIKNKTFFIVPNGYDDNVIEIVENIEQNSEILSIGFSGTIQKWHPIENVISVFSELINAGENFKINFYGINIGDKIELLIDQKFTNLKNVIKIYPKLKNEDYVKEAVKNNIFLLFSDYEFIGTKIYDYLAMKRLILLCFNNDTESNVLKEKFYTLQNTDKNICSDKLQAELIKETNSGIVIENSDDLYNIMCKLEKEFSENGKIVCNSKNIENYSRKKRAEDLAKILN
ncbi:MAG: hypothetical protein LBV69_04255 [Bacteroidales bacterium]|jgi:glycosyltransferase involved in cell wall biosynthesis|nr:hypothetical protein [Bacteroidales bacterium]